MTHEVCSIFIQNTVKQGRSLTYMVSPDKIQHVRWKSEVSAERTLKGRKNVSQSVKPMVSVTFSKVSKTDLAFVQPGAKINSVYYCENVLEQGLVPAIRSISNNDFVFKQDGAPCTPFTTLSLTCIPMCLIVHWTTKLAAKSPDLNPADYSVWTAL